MFKINQKKISQDFGSLRKMSAKLGIKKSTLDHLLYSRKTLTFRSDTVREIANKLIGDGYLYYADDVQTPNPSSTTKEPR